MEFDVVGPMSHVEIIAVGKSIREVKRLRRTYGPARWRKLKAVATIRLPDGTTCKAEVHWYEARGIGKKEMKIKRLLRE